MKCDGELLEFNNALWTNEELLNEEDEDEKKPGNAKYKHYNELPISKIMLVDVESGRKVVLELPEQQDLKPLLWYMK